MPLFKRDTVLRPGAARALTLQALHRSKRARRELLIVVPLLVAVLVVNDRREAWFSDELQTPVKLAVGLVIALLGWRLARDLGRSLMPWLHRRLDTATAGTVGFLIRLALLLVTTLAAARVVGINSQTLAVGGAVF